MKSKTKYAFIVSFVLLLIAFIISIYSLHKQSEEYKILEATYHADTCDMGYGERRLIEILNDE